MSLLSPEHIRIGLGATYAVLARTSGNRVTHWRMQAWDAPDGWQRPLHAVSAWIEELKPRNARASIALSAELAPLQLLPWRDDATREEQQALLARAHWRRTHGEMAETWKVLVRSGGYGRPWLVGAVDDALLEAANQLPRAPISVMPLAFSLLDVLRPRLNARTCWFLAPEPGRTTAMHVRDGHWSLLRNVPASDLRHEPVIDLLMRETRLAGLPDQPATVYLVAGKAAGCTSLDPGWQADPAIPRDSPLHLLGGHR